MGEFDLIRRHFTRPAPRAILGVGDDCALLAPPSGELLAISSDMLVEGRHFLSTVDPARLGHKALAVNLSDLAAMGAAPLAYTLALALPRADDGWLAAFAAGLHALADRHGIELVGGDTTAGPLNICITVFGSVPAAQALRRDGAQAGDLIWVSHAPGGGLGDARVALEAFRGTLALSGEQFEQARRAMELPAPRVSLGMALRGVASAAIDLSDGLIGDLGHVATASGLRAEIDGQAVPAGAVLRTLAGPQAERWRRLATLAGGDDYELAFTAPAAAREHVLDACRRAGVVATCIGRMLEGEPAVEVRGPDGQPLAALPRGFDHFDDAAPGSSST